MLSTSCRPLGLYKIPGRKCLDEICKLNLLEATQAARVAVIWNEHHKQFMQYWGRAISAEAYNALQPRLRQCPYFVIPVFRTKGLFNVVTNWDRDLIATAPLAEWQQKQDHAQPHMTIQFFTELARTKNLVLVRCEIKDNVFVRQDCVFITQMLLRYYSIPRLYESWVEVFNKHPNRFDYHMFLKNMKDEARRDDIRIEDKKTESRFDAYGPVIDIPPDAVAQEILRSASLDVSESNTANGHGDQAPT
ncbi:putative ATP11 protein [Trypanosoma vivax]|uniref:ATP synthase mitochondrial F1 complex assembly factor 1 n=1 Tax=Trypanosoma vivax (strain Y486) TaxID=1055687 RepID=G0U3S1_TRYVY|nr:hypothetical protein TRVL_02277 [Trypanosoma vivax]KAH8614050.1 putative ATP11 protein [Trypanosoma vivax]CCC50930.1 conserved hypothetical protein [Trypanosoma vivax Y486]